MGFVYLSNEEIAAIVFDTKGLNRQQKTWLEDKERGLRFTKVYFRMSTLWNALCDLLDEKQTPPLNLSSAIVLLLQQDGNFNNGEKRFFIGRLTKHFARIEAQQKAQKKNLPQEKGQVDTESRPFSSAT